jgi:DNA repair exonuclease SbcCD nuclease subunit
MHLSFLAYSDIHHDEYTNGITLEDTIAIEDQITEYAYKNNIKRVYFLGDLYRATNPKQSVIKAAEAAWKRRSDTAVTTIALVGNHDRETKAIDSRHAYGAVDIFVNDLKNVVVIDEVKELQNNEYGEYSFIMVPAGHKLDHTIIEPTPTKKNVQNPLIIMFHDLLTGSALSSGTFATDGVNPENIKMYNPMLVLGGDNHKHQFLDNLFDCQSMYLGAPLQHRWDDRGQKRGFWEFNMSEGNITWTHHLTKTPRFVRVQVEAKTEMETLMAITTELNSQLGGCPGIVEITLIGKNAANINLEFLEQNLDFEFRRLRFIVDKTIERIEVVAGLSSAQTPEDKWKMYVAGQSDNRLQPDTLAEMGAIALSEAGK